MIRVPTKSEVVALDLGGECTATDFAINHSFGDIRGFLVMDDRSLHNSGCVVGDRFFSRLVRNTGFGARLVLDMHECSNVDRHVLKKYIQACHEKNIPIIMGRVAEEDTSGIEWVYYPQKQILVSKDIVLGVPQYGSIRFLYEMIHNVRDHVISELSTMKSSYEITETTLNEVKASSLSEQMGIYSTKRFRHVFRRIY